MTAIYLLIIAWLPGAVIFRLPFAERDKRAGLDAEERLFWAVIISAMVSLAVVLASPSRTATASSACSSRISAWR